ncbi:MAG TPA: cyclic nucleotide-binding domain-containing protein [Gaiellaceae bacterium]|jgi:CRP/FNR family transcriptional regulator, cyclic AMP receptor protein|nr:cyclic nucleotide-binding domain-containing protein [Gaiellaceae bacterium]
MLRKNAKVELIKGVPLFAECSRKELGEVAGIADEIDLREGKELTKQGQAGREFFILVEGTADVKKGSRRVNRLGPGDFFGEISLIRHTPRTATVVATSPVRTLVITERSFQSLLQHQPGIQNKVMSALAARLAPDEKI